MPPKHLDLNIAGFSQPSRQRRIEIFLSYCEDCEEDKKLKGELEKHLSYLKRQMGVIVWHSGKVSPGGRWEEEVNAHLHSADIILLLVSSDYISSDYYYEKEIWPAINRCQAGEARVIPILLRAVYYPFELLQVLPSNGKPIVLWEDRDEAFCCVACSIREIVEGMM